MATQLPQCPGCGQHMTYVYQYQRWFCATCQMYRQPVSYQQPYYYYPPVPQPVSENSAKSKVFTSFRMRHDSDRSISQLWPGVLAMLQVLMLILMIVGIFLLLDDLNAYMIDPYQIPTISSLALLFIIISFLISLFLTILQAFLAFRTVLRRDEHFRRDWLLRDGAIEYLDAKSLTQKVDLNAERWTMGTIHQTANLEERERSAILWALLIGLLSFIPLVGYILIMYVLHFLCKEQRQHEDRQLAFNNQLQKGLLKLGKTPPSSWQPMPRRNTALYIMLSIITLGFFIPYWWYAVITDMNAHVSAQWTFEDGLVHLMQEE